MEAYGTAKRGTRKKHVLYVAESVNPKGSIMPAVPFLSYFIIIPLEEKRGKWKFIVKKWFVKKLLTVAEMISQW